MDYLITFFKLDPALALAMTLVLILVPICVVLAYRRGAKRRFLSSLAWSIPPLMLLLLLVGGSAAPAAQAYFRRVACEASDDSPIWHANGSISAEELLPKQLLDDAAAMAQTILFSPDHPNRAWVAQHRSSIEYSFSRLGGWFEQRQWPHDDTAHDAGANGSRIDRMAECDHESRKKICLYVDEIKLSFARHGLDNPAAQSTFLAFTLIHELCHLPRECGGFLRRAVPGDVQGKLPPIEHIGLYRWICDMASCFAKSAGRSAEEAMAARACEDAQRLILDPGSGVYGHALKRHRSMDAHIEEGPAGPERWCPAGIPSCD